MWHVGDCGVHVVGLKMSKDIGMGVCKVLRCRFIPTLFGCFLEISSLYVFYNVFFVTCFSFLGAGRGGGGDILLSCR